MIYAKVIYPLFMKRRSLHKKGINYLSITSQMRFDNIFRNFIRFAVCSGFFGFVPDFSDSLDLKVFLDLKSKFTLLQDFKH